MNATRLRWLLACAFCLLLLTALVATKHKGIGERPIHSRVAMRQKEYARHLADGNAAMK